MNEASFRFYASLNDFIPLAEREGPRSYCFRGRPAIKDAIEAIGIPHSEINLILVNGEFAGFEKPLEHGDRVSVYPRFYALDIRGESQIHMPLLGEMCFVLDTHLGRLARYLRMLGLDSLYRNDYDDDELAEISAAEGRILLTRDRGILKRNEVVYGYCLRSVQPRKQLEEILTRFDLESWIHPFSRCMHCNHMLQSTTKEKISQHVPERIAVEIDHFMICPGCKRVYWKGSHHAKMQRLITRVLKASGYQLALSQVNIELE